MPRFAANLSMMYQEVGFLDRFAAAAADGFQAVEFLFPYAHPVEAVAAALRASGVRNVLFNLPQMRPRKKKTHTYKLFSSLKIKSSLHYLPVLMPNRYPPVLLASSLMGM